LLGGLCVVLVGVAAVGWRVPVRGGRRWFELTQLPGGSLATGSAPAATAAPSVPIAPQPESAADLPWTYQRPKLEVVSAVPSPTSIGGLEVTTVLDNGWLARMAAGEEEETAPGALRTEVLSTEALLDLEQQVEFLIVLGQEAAAVRLLSNHLDGSAGASPLPFYLLLEIHRRRDEEAAYARVAEAFHDRFGAFAQGWEEDVGDAHSLEDHGVMVSRLQDVWARPEDAMRMLDGWIFRRQPGDRAFDFGTCRDLLFLFAVASDLAVAEGGVDVPLPLEGDGAVDVHLAEMPPSRYGAVDVPLRPVLDLDFSEPGPLDSRPTPLRRAG
jgi:hypothetical protein